MRVKFIKCYFEKDAFANSDSQLYKQAGNGVTVNVIEAIAEQLRFAQVNNIRQPIITR